MTNEPTRYRALCGAIVTVTERQGRHVWRCDCGDESSTPAAARIAREDANRHAGTCRALPPYAP